MNLMVRTVGYAAPVIDSALHRFIASMRREVQAIDRNLPLAAVQTLARRDRQRVWEPAVSGAVEHLRNRRR